MSSLFRPEALAAQSSQWLGSVRLTQPIGYTLVSGVGLSVAVLIGLFAYFGTYTKKATVPGLLTPATGALRITHAGNGAGGTLTDVRAHEGDSVKTGDVLFVVSSERTSELGDTQALIARELKHRAQITERDVALSKQRAGERIQSLESRIRAIGGDIASFARDAELFAARERIAKEGLDRFEQLVSRGFTSSAQTDAKREELLALQAQQQTLNRNKAGLQREREALTAQINETRLQAQSEASELEKSRALLSQETTENQARTKLVITAPSAGRVTGVNVQPGQTIAPGALLATLLPQDALGNDQALEAHFFATTRQAGFVEKGQSVLIRFSAFPYQKFGMGQGEVIEVSRSPYAVQELPTYVAATLNNLAQEGDPVYRVTVRMNKQAVQAYGQAHALKPGMLAEADIVQDKRRLWEWALEPIFSVSGKFISVYAPHVTPVFYRRARNTAAAPKNSLRVATMQTTLQPKGSG